MDPIGWLIGFAVMVVVAVLFLSALWWVARWRGGEPMSDVERAVPAAEGRLPPSVFGGGGVGYRQPGL